MDLDAIIAQLRELAADATRAAKHPASECRGACPHAERAAALGARFTELDAVLTHTGRRPVSWSPAALPAQRDAS